MAGSVNKVILVGNLGKDPEIDTLQSGRKVANLPVATSETWNDRQIGERKARAEWRRVVIFNDRLADIAERSLRKGREASIAGSPGTRKYTDQSGQEKYTSEVALRNFRGALTLLDSNRGKAGGMGESGGDRARAQQRAAPGASRGGGRSWDAPRGGDLHDEIPFSERRRAGNLALAGLLGAPYYPGRRPVIAGMVLIATIT